MFQLFSFQNNLRYCFGLLSFLFSLSLSAQRGGASPVADSIASCTIEASAQVFPKFYAAFRQIKKMDTLIKKFKFIDTAGIGPAFAAPNGVITININFLEHPKPNMDDNRLIVVLYHEIGHLHYYQTTRRPLWNPEDSEKAAFEYSLLKTKELALAGDCLPLATGVKFMKLRSESNDLQDAHVRALKRMVNEPLYADYVQWVAAHCK